MTGNSTFTNASGATFAVNSGSYTSTGLVTNNGTTTVASGATLTGNAGIRNTGTFTSNGTVAGGLTNTSTLTPMAARSMARSPTTAAVNSRSRHGDG